MNEEAEVKRYSALELFIAGIRDGLNLKYPIRWILRQVTVRTAVAFCVYWSSAAFFFSMVITDILGMHGESTTIKLLVFYPLSAVIQFFCSPQHKLIADIIQRRIQHFEAKNAAKDKAGRKTAPVAAGGDSLGVMELLEGLTKSLTETVFRLLFYYVIIVETSVVSMLPLGLGWILRVALCSWLYVFNCLLIRWEHYNWRIQRMLAEFRLRWLYYLGLGLPFSFLCNTFSFMTNVLLYCILCPFFEIFVICAADGDKKGPYKEVPAEASSPAAAADGEQQQQPQEAQKQQQQQEQQPVTVPVFFCAELITNKIIGVLSMLKSRLIASIDSKDTATDHTKSD